MSVFIGKPLHLGEPLVCQLILAVFCIVHGIDIGPVKAAPGHFLRQLLYPGHHHGVIVLMDQMIRLMLDQFQRLAVHAAGQQVLNGLGYIAFLLEISGGFEVQSRSPAGGALCQQAFQEIAEQMVVTVFAPFIVQRQQEPIFFADLPQHPARVACAGHGIAKRLRKSLQDAGFYGKIQLFRRPGA